MNTLLIVREEIACIIILLLLFFTERAYDTGEDHKSFTRLMIFAMGHLVFDIVTILTVNHIPDVAPWLNKTCHFIFYLFAMLFANEIFNYIHALYVSRGTSRRIHYISLVPILVYAVALPFLPLRYDQGNGTFYSNGIALYIGYGLAMLYFVLGILLIIVNRRRSSESVRRFLLPMLVIIIALEIFQAFKPELLFTGATVTIITTAFFFTLENPADVYRQRAQMDALTGVDSRHSYEIAVNQLEQRYSKNPKELFAMVFCDINALKAVNNLYGHAEGDHYISTIARILKSELKGAEKIFRMGGDEFLALYIGKKEDVVRREIAAVHAACEKESKEHPYVVAAAMGYALSGGNYHTVRDVLRVADYYMYKNKAELKQHKAFDDSSEKLNLSGLTDRMFEAFATSGDRNYIYVCNMETNVSRLSRPMVDYFGLPGEFLKDFGLIWLEYIHPDDREAYSADIAALFNGAQDSHDMEYRVRNSEGEYVSVTCKGSILHGKNGEPTLFGGTIVNHGILETVDPVTGLPNERAFSARLNELIAHHTEGVLIKFGITTFSRINMLYGYPNGNEVLCTLCSRVKQILRGHGQLYRIDGTEFAIVLPNANEEDARKVFRRIRQAAASEVNVEFRTIPLRLSAGAIIVDHRFEAAPSAMRSALIYAHEQSRYEQNGKLVFYNPPGKTGEVQDVKLLALIHQDAVGERRGFHLCYQPIVSFDHEKPVGAEALLRWQSDEYGVVMPGRFIPWLENDPCFFELGRWIMLTALQDMLPLVQAHPDFEININITMQQLQNEDFHDMVLSALEATGFPAKNLCLELTERCKELDPNLLRSEILFFHEHGLRVALDDVGTGSASFGLLLKLPLDEIKIDMSIVQEINDQKPNQILAKSIVDASETLKFNICFEGIEDERTYQYLSRYPGCWYQGYYYARPMPKDELMEHFRKKA